MPLEADSPYTIPATPSKTFGEMWVSLLTISAPSISSGRLQIETVPYNATTQEIGPADGMQTILTNNLFAVLSNPAAVKTRAAYAAIMDAIPELANIIKAMEEASRSSPAAEPTP